jgi:nicotinate-nucleotide pyrophosphorylase (carboxylating)
MRSVVVAGRIIVWIFPTVSCSSTITSRSPEASFPRFERAIRNRRGEQIIEIEIRTLDELKQALDHGAEAILLDHMTSDDVRRAVEMCSGRDRRIPLECSGGITLENIRAYAETGVDFISVGALTQSA